MHRGRHYQVEGRPEGDGAKVALRFYDRDSGSDGDREDRTDDREDRTDDLLLTPGYKDHYILTAQGGQVRARTLQDYACTNHGGERVIEAYAVAFAVRDGEPVERLWEGSVRRLRVEPDHIVGLSPMLQVASFPRESCTACVDERHLCEVPKWTPPQDRRPAAHCAISLCSDRAGQRAGWLAAH